MKSTKGRIKILQTIRQGSIGGGESHVLNLVENLDKKLFEPVILSFTDGQMITRLRQQGVRCHIIPSLRGFDISKWRQVKRFMKNEKFDLIHIHGTRANTNVYWAAGILNIPTIYTIHGWSFHPDQNFPVKNIRMLAENYLTKKTTLNISVSKANQRSGQQLLGNFDSIIVNYGIDLKKFNPKNNFKDLRTHYNLQAHTVLIGFIARMTKQKDPLTMIAAFAQSLQYHTDIKLLMIGNGELRKNAEQLAKDLQINDKVIFDDFTEDVPSALNAIDIFCLPSLWEGLPIGLLEAMAMGKAVIASAVDGSPEVLTNNENGLLIKPGDVSALSNAINVLCKDKSLRTQFGENALKTITQEYNAVSMTRKIEMLYQQVYSEKNIRKHEPTL